MRTNRPAARLRLSTGSGTFGSSLFMMRFIQPDPSSPVGKQRATHAWRHEVVVPGSSEQDLRRVGEEPGTLQIDALVEGKDQRYSEAEQVGRPVKKNERERQVKKRDPKKQKVDGGEEQSGIGAEYCHEIDEIERKTERRNKIEKNEIQSLKRIRQPFKPVEQPQLAVHHEANSQGIAIPARALAQQTQT